MTKKINHDAGEGIRELAICDEGNGNCTRISPPSSLEVGVCKTKRGFYLDKNLPCGTVSVNTFSEGDIKTPFGGYKQSGSLSRDQGTEALNSFLQTKTIWISHS